LPAVGAVHRLRRRRRHRGKPQTSLGVDGVSQFHVGAGKIEPLVRKLRAAMESALLRNIDQRSYFSELIAAGGKVFGIKIHSGGRGQTVIVIHGQSDTTRAAIRELGAGGMSALL